MLPIELADGDTRLELDDELLRMVRRIARRLHPERDRGAKVRRAPGRALSQSGLRVEVNVDPRGSSPVLAVAPCSATLPAQSDIPRPFQKSGALGVEGQPRRVRLSLEKDLR